MAASSLRAEAEAEAEAETEAETETGATEALWLKYVCVGGGGWLAMLLAEDLMILMMAQGSWLGL